MLQSWQRGTVQPLLKQLPRAAWEVAEADGEKAFVMAYDAASHRARRRAVRFGGFDGDDALVAGLPPDAQVITAGAGYVSDGEVVSVVDPARLAVEATGARR